MNLDHKLYPVECMSSTSSQWEAIKVCPVAHHFPFSKVFVLFYKSKIKNYNCKTQRYSHKILKWIKYSGFEVVVEWMLWHRFSDCYHKGIQQYHIENFYKYRNIIINSVLTERLCYRCKLWKFHYTNMNLYGFVFHAANLILNHLYCSFILSK